MDKSDEKTGIFNEIGKTESLAAKALPCVFNNRAVFPNGKFVTENQTDGAAPEKILRRGGK